MKVASFNVNSLRVRLDPLLDWMEENEPDVLCLQETKTHDREFPVEAFGDLGYDVIFTGQNAHNGVAIATRAEVTSVHKDLPGFEAPDQRRLISCEVEGVRIVDVYCPNGTSIGSDRYRYKLDWYEGLRRHLGELRATGRPMIVCGDFNVAPTDADVWDPAAFVGSIHTSEPEREAYRRVLEAGFVDAFRAKHPDRPGFTWWDYRGAGYQRDQGMRIDLFLLTPDLLPAVKEISVDTSLRRGEQPSDHAPLVLELDR